MWAIMTSAVHHTYMYIYGKNTSFFRSLTPPTHRGVIITQPIFRSGGGGFFERRAGITILEGLRSPEAHLDTVLRNLLNHLGRPFTAQGVVEYGFKMPVL